MQSSFQNQAITQRVGRRPLAGRILDADEAEDRAQVSVLKVVGLLRRSRRITPPRDEAMNTPLAPASLELHVLPAMIMRSSHALGIVKRRMKIESLGVPNNNRASSAI
jgi:hypothetical protein